MSWLLAWRVMNYEILNDGSIPVLVRSSLDGQGRIVVPAKLRAYAKLEDECDDSWSSRSY